MRLVKPPLSLRPTKEVVIPATITQVVNRTAGGGWSTVNSTDSILQQSKLGIYSPGAYVYYDSASYRSSSMRFTGKINRVRIEITGNIDMNIGFSNAISFTATKRGNFVVNVERNEGTINIGSGALSGYGLLIKVFPEFVYLD